ncbi:hypothetical protein Desgi_3439 [Desulfoscipio gibsoniae DSM 7213]|uniref:DUF3149 domain-containing protein n=1 Tax=Desulfoscipio gibsoniae DSM 7213 TaxID=767817 RepID=R4KMJ6_9FIRM|nr:hypothetical protein Desgi_3439 [Desulfoscipio gibsoniae DSM 7213]
MPMMYGYGSLWGLGMMIVSLGIFGLIIYWAVYSGVRKGLKEGPRDKD